jgi:methylmalonyl-CoA/ethylmalonyl-CoA epimerase
MSGNSLPHGVIADLLVSVDHVGIAVPELEAGLAFYRDTLGLELVHREDNTDQRVTEAMLATPGGPDSAQLQLLAPLGDDSPIAKFLDRAGPGLQQLALRVTDARAAGDRLREAGLRVLYDEPRRGTADSLINFVHPRDTGGVLIELVQPAAAD